MKTDKTQGLDCKSDNFSQELFGRMEENKNAFLNSCVCCFCGNSWMSQWVMIIKSGCPSVAPFVSVAPQLMEQWPYLCPAPPTLPSNPSVFTFKSASDEISRAGGYVWEKSWRHDAKNTKRWEEEKGFCIVWTKTDCINRDESILYQTDSLLTNRCPKTNRHFSLEWVDVFESPCKLYVSQKEIYRAII